MIITCKTTPPLRRIQSSVSPKSGGNTQGIYGRCFTDTASTAFLGGVARLSDSTRCRKISFKVRSRGLCPACCTESVRSMLVRRQKYLNNNCKYIRQHRCGYRYQRLVRCLLVSDTGSVIGASLCDATALDNSNPML